MADIDAVDNHIGRREPTIYGSLKYMFERHTYHTFKEYTQGDTIICKVCGTHREHDIHKVGWATENRRKVHDFYPVRTVRNDAPLCMYCDMKENYSMHQNVSALFKGAPSKSLPDEPPTYGTHMYVTADPSDHTLPCLACRYNEDAEHHITIGSIASSAVLDYVRKEEQYRKDNEPKSQSRTIAQEASDIVYGDREEAYDDPNVNFEKLALMWTAVLLRKLKPGVQVSARDVALMQVCLKIARESFRPKRDNRVDIIGYTLCLQRIDDNETYQDEEDEDDYNSEDDDE